MIEPPGEDDPTLDPPPLNEAEEHERRQRIAVADIVQWYIDHSLPLDVTLHEWRIDVEGRGER